MDAFLNGFLDILRKSNLVVDRAASTKVSLRSDVRQFPRIVRASKTIPFQERIFSLSLLRIPGSLLCPVAALSNRLHITQVPQDMSLFSVRSAGSTRPITYAHFCSFLTRVISAVDLESSGYSPYRFRRGGATFAFQAQNTI